MNEYLSILRQGYFERRKVAVAKLLDNYGERGLTVQRLAYPNALDITLAVHLPTTFQSERDSIRVTASLDKNVVDTVRKVAKGTALAYDLQGNVNDAVFSAGGIYVTYIAFQEKEKPPFRRDSIPHSN